MNNAIAYKEKNLNNLNEGEYMFGYAAYIISEKLLVPFTGSQRNHVYSPKDNSILMRSYDR